MILRMAKVVLEPSAIRRRRLGFAPALTHRVEVAPGPGSRPGERLLAPSRSAYAPAMSEVCGSRRDLAVMLGPRGSGLLVVCLGLVAERGDPWETAWHTPPMSGLEILQSPVLTRMAGEDAVFYRVGMASGAVLHEWKLDRDGWLFAIGIQQSPRDDPAATLLGLRALDTFRWIDPPAEAAT